MKKKSKCYTVCCVVWCKHPWENWTLEYLMILQPWHVNLECALFSFIPPNPYDY